MKLFTDVADQLQKYYLGRDFDALHEARRLIEAEIDEPQLQEATITVPIEMAVIEQTIKTQGFLRLSLQEGDSSAPVEVDKLVRVFPSDRAEVEGCLVLNVAYMDGVQVVLVPTGGPE